jgi:hypothetical protein
VRFSPVNGVVFTDSEDSAAGELSIVGHRRLSFSFFTQPAADESAGCFRASSSFRSRSACISC